MESYVSSEKNAKKRSSINTCLKSLNQMIDDHKESETEQNYTEIDFYGSLADIENATFKYPRKLDQEIPIFGTVNLKYRLIGYTDGKTLTVNSDIKESENTEETVTDTITEISEEEYKNGVSKTTIDGKTYLNQLIVRTTQTFIYTKEEIEPEEEEEEPTYKYYLHYTKKVFKDLSNVKVYICMRF